MGLPIVIPVRDKEEGIGTLINKITLALDWQYQYEIIVVDDSNIDNV